MGYRGTFFFEFSCSVAWGHRGAVYQGFRGSALAKSPDFRVLPGRRKTADSTGSKDIQGGVAQALNGRGTPARRGGTWSAVQVRRVLAHHAGKADEA